MDSRDKILETAARLFQVKGYHATGLNEIIAASGSPKGSLYYYFPGGKVELAVEAIRFASNVIVRRGKRILSSESDPTKAIQLNIEDIAEHFRSGGASDDLSFCMIALESSNENEQLRLACEAAFDERERLFFDKLLAGGYAEEEARRLAALVQILIEGAIVATRTRKDVAALVEVSALIPSLLSR